MDSSVAQDRLPHNSAIARDVGEPSIAGLKLDFLSSKTGCSLQIGSSLDCDINLKENKATCWISWLHAELTPHPDEDTIYLQNMSTTHFDIRLRGSENIQYIYPKQAMYLYHGVWQVKFGEGLDFRLLVFRRSPPPPLPAGLRRGRADLTRRERSQSRGSDSGSGASTKKSLTKGRQFLRRTPSSSRSARRRIQNPISSTLLESQDVHARLLTERHDVTLPVEESQRATQIAQTTELKHYDGERGEKSKSHAPNSTRRNELSKVSTSEGKVRMKKVYGRYGRDIIDRRTSYLAERDTLNSLGDHEHIVKMLAFNDRRLSIELEWITGSDLSAFRDEDGRCTLDTNEAWIVWRQMSDALAHIHARDLIHCDVKPNNIMFDRINSKTVLIDFDVACKGSLQTSYNGTPPYWSPELFLEYGRATKPKEVELDKEDQTAAIPPPYARDVWAFGVTLLFVLKFIKVPKLNIDLRKLHWGHRDKVEEAERKKLRNTWRLWLNEVEAIGKQVPAELLLIARMLDWNPYNRISSKDLNTVLGDQKQLKPKENEKEKERLPLLVNS